jgi:hypothetical protein
VTGLPHDANDGEAAHEARFTGLDPGWLAAFPRSRPIGDSTAAGPSGRFVARRVDSLDHLASYHHCVERVGGRWAAFQAKRAERLRERERFGHAAERATENILEDLFTDVLDWSRSDVNHQVGYADILLTRLGIKYLVVEAKRPGALAWHRHAVEGALGQACRYAGEQRVRCVAVSDGVMLYAADVRHGGLRDRVFCSLDRLEPPEALWWLSVHGIYRDRGEVSDAALRLLPEAVVMEPIAGGQAGGQSLHPKYKLPAPCFAYVGNAADPHTWHLPYLKADGTVDVRRLPKAVQAILSNYRGARVSSVPEAAIPDVLVRLACAAGSLGRLPDQCAEPAVVYVQLVAALEQLGRLADVRLVDGQDGAG